MLNWDEIDKKVAYSQPKASPVTAAKQKIQNSAPSTSFQSVLDEYNTSLPGIGRPYASTLSKERKQEMAQGTQRFFEQVPVQAGFMQGFSYINPVESLEDKLGTDIDTSQAETQLPYKIGEGLGIAAQFAVPYSAATKGITALPKVANVGARFGRGISKIAPKVAEETAQRIGQGIAGSAATDIAVGAPLNINYAFNKEGLQGAEAAKSIAVNTGIDLVTGGILEAVPFILKSGKKVASKADFEALPPQEKQEVMSELERLAYESNVRKGKITPQSDTLYGNAFQQTAGELPAPKKTYLHATNKEFEKFKPAGDGLIYFSEKQNGVKTKADAIFSTPANNRMIESQIDESKVRHFDPFSDPEAKAIAEKYGLPTDRSYVKWDEISPMSLEAIKKGYNSFEVLEPNGGYSRAIADPDLISITNNIRKSNAPEPYAAAKGQKEVPRTVTPGEVSGRIGRGLQTSIQASDVPVQPRNQNFGTVAPPQSPTRPVEQKFKDLGADTNRFEEVAQVLTDSKQARPSIKEMAGDLVSNVKRKFIDSGDTVAKIAKENNDPGLYNLYNNAKQSRRRAEYHIGEAQTDLMGNKVGKSLKEIFDPIRKKGDEYYEDFQEYMYHLHNIDRMGFEEKAKQRLREFEIQHQELADLTDKELKEMLKTADNDSGAVIREYMKLIDDVNTAPSKPVFGKSITADESRKVSDYLLQQHPEFAQEAGEVRKYLDNMMQYRVDSGLVSQEGADALAETYKNYVPTYRVNPSMKGLKTFGNNANIATGIKKAMGSSKDLLPLHEQIARQTMQTVEAAHKNLFGQRLAQNINDNTGKYVQELKKVDDKVDIDAVDVPELKNTFNVYENGQAYQMKVDKGLYEGIQALAESDPNELVKAATAANRGFKELITSWNPMFLVRNVARDIQDVGLYSKDLKGFAKSYPAAIKEISTNGEIWKQYKALGGAGNSFFDYAKWYKKDPTWLRKNTLDRVEALNMATEQLPRFTEFMASIEKLGHQPSYDELMQAMHNAADVTVNFGRSGTWGKTLNSTFVPFFNPAMQGASKLVRRFTGTKGVKEWTELVLKVSALGVAPSLINEMVYSDDPQYQIINDREKDINFLFKTGDGEWLKIPKGRVLSLFGSGAQRTFRGLKGEENAFAGYIKTMGDQVAPISPTESNIYSPIAAVRNNKSWFGGRIEPMRLEKYSPGLRYDESTTELAKTIGGATNLSPKKIDYLLDAYSGVIGDFTMPLMTPKAERNPFEKAFVLDSVSSNKLSQQFYDKIDEIKYAKNDVDGEDKNDILSRYMNKQSDALNDVYAEIRKTENSGISNKLKREKVRDLKGMVNGMIQTSLDTLPEVEKATEQLSKKYKDTDVLYREVNREVFGAEYALKTYNKDTYTKAQKYNSAGLSYDDFYKVYFTVKDIEGDKKPNGDTITGSASKKKKAAIDAAFPNASRDQLKLMYEMAGVGTTVGNYRKQFE